VMNVEVTRATRDLVFDGTLTPWLDPDDDAP
jgi:hypothetical protein